MNRKAITGKTILIVVIAVLASCKPSDDKMRIKLNRKIERSQQKITKQERKIAGYEQQLAHLVETDSTADSRKGTLVTTIQPQQKKFRKFIDIQGAVSSKENIMVSANTGGVLMSVPITEGQDVSRGQTLAVVNSDVLQSNIKEVENQLELATAVYERQQRLWEEQNIGTELQYLEARNNKNALERKLSTLQVQLSDATVVAPISGTVDEVFALQGQMVGPGTVVARIVNLNKVQVEAEVPESYVGVFRKGDQVDIYFQSLGITRSATIRAVGQVINPGNRTFKVEIDLPNSDGMLKPNLLATLRLKEYESENNLIIPTRLIQDGSHGNFVLTVADETVEKKWVTVGESYNGESEILDGLEAGDQIIDLGFREVLEGESVQVRQTS